MATKSKSNSNILMDTVKDKAEELITKIATDKKFAAKFKKDPVKAVESVIGIDLPDEKINAIIDMVKAKVTVDTATNLLGKFKTLLNKKK